MDRFAAFLAGKYGPGVGAGTLTVHSNRDLGATIASGSHGCSGMAIVPCSMKTLAAIAHGLSRNLIERAADVMLKERRRLVIVPRETPMSLPQLRNMVLCAEAGAMILRRCRRSTTAEDARRSCGLHRRENSVGARLRARSLSTVDRCHPGWLTADGTTKDTKRKLTKFTKRADLFVSFVLSWRSWAERSTMLKSPDISKSPERIAGMFDAIAGRYDLLNHLLSAGIDRRWRRRAIQSLRLTGTERVLDLCTERATWRSRRRAHGRPRRASLAVDFAGAMLGVGRKSSSASGSNVASRWCAATRRASGCRSLGRRGDDRVSASATSTRWLPRATRCDESCAGRPPRHPRVRVPTVPGLSSLYLGYLHHVLPRIGRAVSRHNAAYGYLPASIGAFSTPTEFVAVLAGAGFFIDFRERSDLRPASFCILL